MTDGRPFAQLRNAGGELIAEGPCHVDEAAGTAMLEPEREPGALQKERGVLALDLESGESFRVSDKAMIFQIQEPSGRGRYRRRRMYRLRLLSNAQDADGADVAGEGTPATSARLRRSPEGGAPDRPADRHSAPYAS